MRRALILGFLLVLNLGSSATVHAAQRARVVSENAGVFVQPNPATEITALVHQGATLYISSRYLETSDGNRWYKVFLDSGKFGFIKSTEVYTEEAQRAQQAMGLAQAAEWEADDGGVWTFALRALGLGGAAFGSASSFVGAEAELSFCVPFWTRTVWRQVVALGAHAQYFGNFELVGPTLIVRIPTLGRAVPEFRARFSGAIPLAQYFAGGSIAVEYPFTLDPSFHFSGTMELGGASSIQSGPVYAWAAAGIGLHF